MFEDGVKVKNQDEQMRVLDLSEMIIQTFPDQRQAETTTAPDSGDSSE
jgi:hypothetical protein